MKSRPIRTWSGDRQQFQHSSPSDKKLQHVLAIWAALLMPLILIAFCVTGNPVVLVGTTILGIPLSLPHAVEQGLHENRLLGGHAGGKAMSKSSRSARAARGRCRLRDTLCTTVALCLLPANTESCA